MKEQQMHTVRFAMAALAMAISAAAGAQQPAAKGATLEEVVVTAQRREESMQDVPIAVTALSGASLSERGVASTEMLSVAAPSVVIGRFSNSARPFVRGIGSTVADPNNEASVAIYLDGVYQPAAFANFFDFNNVERIEVLKGPQGTLFGRNATGGVIQVVTRDPSDTPEFEASAGYANYDKYSVSAYAATPIGDKVGVSIAAMYSDQQDGYGENLVSGEDVRLGDDVGVRAKLVFEPTDATTIKLAADYSELDDTGAAYQMLPGTRNVLGQTPPEDDYDVYNNWEPENKVESVGVSLDVKHDFSAVGLRSITAWRDIDGFWTLDQDLSALPIINADVNQTGEMFSQEFHLTSADDSTLQWLVGAFYFEYDAGYDPLATSGLLFSSPPPLGLGVGPGFTFDNLSEAQSVSVFGQATYPVLEDTNLTLGLRQTWDEADGDAETSLTGTPVVIMTNDISFSDDTPTWRVSLDHQFTDDVMGYISYNRGMKSGGVGITGAANTITTYEPEELDAYEIGVKSDLLDGRARFNAAVFYYDFSSIQFQRVVTGAGVIINGGDAESYGADAELEFQATDNLRLRAGISLLDTEIKDFPNAPCTERTPAGTTVDCAPGYNADGNALTQAPDLTGSLAASYRIPTAIGAIDLNASYYYNDGYCQEIDNRLETDSYELVNASIVWTNHAENLSAQLWGRNLTDEFYFVQALGTANLSDLGTAAAPRTYGVTLSYKYQ